MPAGSSAPSRSSILEAARSRSSAGGVARSNGDGMASAGVVDEEASAGIRGVEVR